MRSPSRTARVAVTLLTIVGTALPPLPGQGGEIVDRVLRTAAAPFKGRQRTPPATGIDCAVERLATEIDWLENHIDRYGSVVAKHPDVWGQSRLTRHRDEYERTLAAELTNFKEINNASLRRSDQSFLGLALAIEAAAGSSGEGGKGKSGGSSDTLTNMVTITTGTGDDTGLVRTRPFSNLTNPATKDLFGLEGNAVGLEPTIHLDHLSRYVQHLHELRRISEGDDITDSPGYSLNLVRIPVSILPGQATQRGHGAEVTVSVDMQLGDELLPTTYRNLVSNDIVDLLASHLTFMVNNPRVRRNYPVGGDDDSQSSTDCCGAHPTEAAPSNFDAPPRGRASRVTTQMEQVVKEVARTRTFTVNIPSTKSRRSRLPVPGEQVVDVLGVLQLCVLTRSVIDALASHPANTPCIQFTDVRRFLSDELDAAHEFLAQPQLQGVWGELPGWNLAGLIRARRLGELEQIRCQFLTRIGSTVAAEAGGGISGEPVLLADPAGSGDDAAPCCNTPENQDLCTTTTGVLAWMILVESALLDARLTEDMRQAASAKGVVGPSAGAWAGPFYGPNPSPEARRAFNDYVRLRWPIRVFALDPITQEQNVEDVFALRRETQIAMALAAAGGRTNTQAMMRYARRLETDLATIALNKTAVGFTHGSDTFGWRFYPRVQTPPTRNNLVNFAETLVGSNSQHRDLAERRIEPGARECTAIIVMPSFVPFVTFDIRTNWFCLTSPRHTDQSIRQALQLSRSVKAMQQAAVCCGQNAGAYRDGEVARLLRRVEQLDRELPLQSMLTQIPYENTSGGFELFNTGVTDLAPELIGWYGGEGIDPSRPTTLYIVGKGFSVHDTTIIAAGQPVNVELISRQVLRATFPRGLSAAKPVPASPKSPCQQCAPAAEAVSRRTPAGVRSPGLAARGQAGEVRLTEGSEPLPPPANPDRTTTLSISASGKLGATTNGGPSGTRIEPIRWRSTVHGSGGNPAMNETSGEHVGLALGDDAVDCNALQTIDVHLATPYGVSNHLLIPLLAAAEQQPGDPAECALAIHPPVSIALSASRNTDKDWRVDEYFDAVPETIAVRVPKWFNPPALASLQWTIRETHEHGRVIAQFSTPAPHFEAASRSYVYAGGELRNLVGDTGRPASDKTLRGALNPYLDRVRKETKEGELRELVAQVGLVAGNQTIPVSGVLPITLRHAGEPPNAEGATTP